MTGLLVEGEVASKVLTVLPGAPRPTGTQCRGDEALSMRFDGDFAVAEVGGWTVVADPQVQAAWSKDVCAALSKGTRVLTFMVQYVTTMYGFAWYIDGQLIRSVIYVEGEPEDQHGVPLPEEAELSDPAAEDHVPDLAARLTGLCLGGLFNTSFAVLRNHGPDNGG